MKKFKTESQRVLDLMINSIYTHKEIFLRELISNASDALDKLYYKSLSENLGLAKEDLRIQIVVDKTARTLTIIDNGIGMSAKDLDENLGVIAKSGSGEFKQDNEKKEDINIIGQFGVGFYSAFMVSEKVTVLSRAFGDDKAAIWESKGAEGYAIKDATKDSHGTVITMTLKQDQEEETYSEFLEEYRIRELIKKYSDYIRYPIEMTVERTEEGKDGEEPKTVQEVAVLNSLVPLWKKRKSDIEESEYNAFYQSMFHDYQDPCKVIHTSAEGAVDYTALLFIPSRAPYNYYSKHFEKGLKLYTNDVMITEKCADLLPDYFGFVAGLVDSDLTLNISRETIQHNRQLQKIAQSLEKKIKKALEDMLESEREAYEKFYKEFGLQLKYGLYEGFGMNKDKLIDLILFHSVKEDKLVSLKEYVGAMGTDQTAIYYATAKNPAAVKAMPQSERVLDLGYDILVFQDEIDEFAIKMVNAYQEKEFRSISQDALDLPKDETQEEPQADDQALLDAIKETLDGAVDEVKTTTRLKSHPVCLTAKGELSIEMEKTLAAMPGGMGAKAEKVLEINRTHPIFKKMKTAFASGGKESITAYAKILLEQARLIEGLQPENPSELAKLICDLLANE